MPIPYTGLDNVVNTPWDILRVAETGNIYLLAGKAWFIARALEGPWRPAESLPRAFRLVPPHHPRAAVRAAKISSDQSAARGSVTVVYEAAELIERTCSAELNADAFLAHVRRLAAEVYSVDQVQPSNIP